MQSKMKKYMSALASALIMTMAMMSCIDETGAGTPAAKRMYLQQSEYTVDLKKGVSPLVLRWIDVTNATYEVTLSNDENEHTETLGNEIKTGELQTMSMDIDFSQIEKYVSDAALTPKDNTVDVNVTVKGSVIDTSQPSVLLTKGDKVDAVIHVLNVE